MMTIAAVFGAITQAGLVPRGALRLEERERLGDLANIRTIALAGFAGRDGWMRLLKAPKPLTAPIIRSTAGVGG